ncbi:hypothetical protein [Parasitella parasitica]|uniref:Uncharacterized protein n=1 Tax=Parasitella parasitica TaxID=35722 RepID=A0A0B7N4R5_9FUNG|nr:hypothetical protein [Parasitella parasitica]
MMNEEESMVDMGKRPSRRHRHLPTSITSAANTRSSEKRRNVTLLGMFNDKEDKSSKTTGYQPTGIATTVKRRRPHQPQRQIHKQKARQIVTKSKTTAAITTKLALYAFSSMWIMFVLYRIYFSMQTEDFTYLSTVHFISKKVANLMQR